MYSFIFEKYKVSTQLLFHFHVVVMTGGLEIGDEDDVLGGSDLLQEAFGDLVDWRKNTREGHVSEKEELALLILHPPWYCCCCCCCCSRRCYYFW